MKVSVYKNSTILVVLQHIYDIDQCQIKFFNDQSKAADYIENLVIEE